MLNRPPTNQTKADARQNAAATALKKRKSSCDSTAATAHAMCGARDPRQVSCGGTASATRQRLLARAINRNHLPPDERPCKGPKQGYFRKTGLKTNNSVSRQEWCTFCRITLHATLFLTSWGYFYTTPWHHQTHGSMIDAPTPSIT